MGISQNAAIAAVGNDVHIVWEDESSRKILYRKSVDSGASFSPVINLSNFGLSDSGFPTIAVSGDSVHVAWQDMLGDDTDIRYRRSTDGGATFTEPMKNLCNNSEESTFPAIAVSGNNVHVV
jgi:hypothetical protein